MHCPAKNETKIVKITHSAPKSSWYGREGIGKTLATADDLSLSNKYLHSSTIPGS